LFGELLHSSLNVISGSSLLGIFAPHLRTPLMVKFFADDLDRYVERKLRKQTVNGLEDAIKVSGTKPVRSTFLSLCN
jgi:hypothetical protein